jgi:hypothetical protein
MSFNFEWDETKTKINLKKKNNNTDEIAEEYDFSKGIRGKYYQKMKDGYSFRVYSTDKNSPGEEVIDRKIFFRIDDDVSKVFKTSEEVNNALSVLITAFPKTRKRATRTV